MTHISTEQRYELIEAHVTLNGKPAKISGVRQQFATVATIDPRGPAVEFSWQAAERIVTKNGGAFWS